MKLTNQISLFFILSMTANILVGQDAYFGDLAPGYNEPAFHSPNRPSTYEHPSDDANLELHRVNKKNKSSGFENSQNIITKKHFSNIFDAELSSFKNCIKSEGTAEESYINTNCKISKALQDAAFILQGKKNIQAIDLLDNFKKFKKIKNSTPRYPKNMLEFGETGYVIVEYDITEKGRIANEEIVEAWCGNISSPFTEFQPCSFFNRESLTSVIKFRYKPSKFENKPVYTKGVKHKFTFSLNPKLSKMKDKVDQAYDEVRNKIIAKDYINAAAIAQNYIEYDNIFLFEKARAHYFNEEYLQASTALFKFIELTKDEKYRYPEEVLLSSLIILVDSLYFSDDFKKIISLDNNVSNYIKEKPQYRRNLAMTSLYLGTSYVNTGDLQQGMYYLGIARKYAPSDAQVKYIDNVINQTANYL